MFNVLFIVCDGIFPDPDAVYPEIPPAEGVPVQV
jgi:hypothetical protein